MICLNPSDSSRHQLRLAVAIYLRNYLKQLISAGRLQQVEIFELLKQILDIVTMPLMHMQIRENLSLSAIPLLTIETEAKKNVLERVIPLLYSKLENTDSSVLSGAMQFVTSMIVPLFEEDIILKISEQLLPLFWNIAETNLAAIKEMLTTLESKKEVDEASKLVSTIDPQLETLHNWCRLIDTLVDKTKTKCRQNLIIYIHSPRYSKIAIDVINLSFPLDYHKETILSVSPFASINTKVNKLKLKLLCSLNTILCFVNENSTKGKASVELDISKELIEIAYKTLNWICISQFTSLPQILKIKEYTDIIVELLRILLNTSQSPRHYSFFSGNIKRLLIDIAFPLMTSSVEEKQMMSSNPEHFVSYALDTCEKHESETFKTEAAKLVENLCEHIDGGLTFTVQLCCQIIGFILSGKNMELLQKYPIIAELSSANSNIPKFNDETLIETSLVVLTGISYLAPKRKDIYYIIEKVFQENFEKLFGTSSTLIKCRIALMMGFYSDNLYANNKEMFANAMSFLINGLASKKEEKAFALQCIDTLKNIVNDSDVIRRVELFINPLLAQLAQILLDIHLPSFFDVVILVINTYSQVIDSTIVVLFGNLVKRILHECELEKAKGSTKNNIFISSCWNTIHCIVGKNDFHPIFSEEMEKTLMPLLNFLSKPEEIEFDDDILSAISILIKKKGSVSAVFVMVFPLLEKIYTKNKGLLTDLMGVLNSYIYCGRDFLVQNPAYIVLVK